MNAPARGPQSTDAANVDVERFRLGRFLACLGADELDVREQPIDLADIAAALDGNPRAMLFRQAGPERAAPVGGVCASRSRLAKAFETTADGLLGELLRRLRTPQPVVEIAREQAPVQSVVRTGDEANLTALPAHLQHQLDGAPYLSASIDFAIDPATGWTNVGVRRLMLRGRRQAGIDLNAPSDLRAIYEGHVRRKAPMPIAFVVGSHPIDHVAATMRLPVDELALLASLRGAALPVVKCVTNDIRVPADAEIVLEGYVDAAGYVEPEGPYGEFLGYYGELKQNPVSHLTAITRRHDAVFQSATISGKTVGRTDTAQLNALRTEAVVWRALETAVREVKSVYAVPASGGAFHMRVALHQRAPGEARNAIAAVFACLANVKNVFVVDPDVDIFADEQIDWALATRFQAGRDLVADSGFRAMPLDPSLEGARTWSKAGFDLTLPFLRPGESRPIANRVPAPPRYEGQRFGSLDAALADGPKFFEELMAALASRDGREIVRQLEAHYASGRLVRDRDGRYSLK